MNIFKPKIFAILSIVIFTILSCSNTDTITISLDQHSNPIIRIENPNGSPIIISPGINNKGTVGFKKNNQTLWIKGMPEVTKEDHFSIYKWNTSDTNTSIIMKLTRLDDDLVLEFNITDSISNPLNPGRWFINLKASENEYFTGIFERVVDGNQNESWAPGITTGMNLRGENIDMKLKPTVSAYAPFYISSGNYGLFVYGTWQGNYDFCKEDTSLVQIAFEGPSLKVKLYMDESPAGIVKKHALETGPSFTPPKWAFGQWRWRDNHHNKQKYYDSTLVNSPYNSYLAEDILMMQAFSIPFTAYWIDRPWATGERGFDDYEIDTNRFPYFEEMLKWLNGKDIELMMWIGPFVMGKMADYAEDQNYDLISKDWKNARQVLMDFTNPEACKWWAENGPGKLAKMGVKGFKLDRADGEKLVDSIHLVTNNGKSYRENYNDYPRQYVKATYDAVKPILGDDYILFPRAQYTGSARYGAMWAGDTRGYHEGLRSAIIGMQRCAVMGYPVWGSDIGGYGKGFTREACFRWLGFGCFSPIMETGPTSDQGFWNSITDPTYDTALIATWRLYSIVRTKLVDYIYDLSLEASETGMPIARPLFLEYPEQQEAWNDWQTYLLGSDILVSIIWEKGKTKHRLYLPEGAEWIDAWDTENVYSGGEYIEVDAPVYKTPVYIKSGSDIELGDLQKIYDESLDIAAKKPNLTELEAAEGWK
ncbi:MAG: glycoside hydrolase family 31 protein [Bacteroidales bacterium]|nr:glycoside hydrolase family 31 protein [Bacteroidales bacterium]